MYDGFPSFNPHTFDEGRSPTRQFKKYETLRICRGCPPEYNAILLAAQIHSKGVQLICEKFPILYYYSRTVGDKKKVSGKVTSFN